MRLQTAFAICVLLTGYSFAQTAPKAPTETPAPTAPVAQSPNRDNRCEHYRTPVIEAPTDYDRAMLLPETERTAAARGKVINPCEDRAQLAQTLPSNIIPQAPRRLTFELTPFITPPASRVLPQQQPAARKTPAEILREGSQPKLKRK